MVLDFIKGFSFQDVKVGDEFLVSYNNSQALAKVSKITPKRFEVGGHTFDKKDGSQIGGSTWSRATVGKLTEQSYNDFKSFIVKKRLFKEVKTSLETFDIEKASKEELETILAILKKCNSK